MGSSHQKRGKIMEKVLISKDDLRKLIIKANYADVQSARAVYERDCKIRGYILPRVEDVYNALDWYKEENGVNLDATDGKSVLFMAVTLLMTRLEDLGLAKKD